jgi:signal transduction histidine kinase
MSSKRDNREHDSNNAGADREAEPRSGFLAFVAHEVRNPLSTALWSAELLARLSTEERGGARGEKLTAMCLRSLGRVRQLVEDHFLCERLDVGGIPVREEPVAAREVLQDLIGKRPADVGEVSLEVDPELVVSADRMLLERALDALLSAAGREGTRVRVSGRSDGAVVTFVFAGVDPGPDPLSDPRKGSPGDPKGRALALPMARRVASALGGGLTAEGGALVLTLPRAPTYTARPDPAVHP